MTASDFQNLHDLLISAVSVIAFAIGFLGGQQ